MLLVGFNSLYTSKVKNIIQNKIFLTGLLFKMILIFFLLPNITSTLFLPFIKNSINNFSFDPWSNFLITGGDLNSFPYGIVMVLAYLPFSFAGHLLDKYIYDYNFFEF